MSLFKLKRSGNPRDLEVSMVGLKLGSSFRYLGGADHDLITTLSKIVGISGEASVAVDSSEAAQRITQAAKSAGLLVDIENTRLDSLPYDADSFDVVVANNLLDKLRINERVLCLQQALKVLRPQGRLVVIEPAPRGGLGALFSQRAVDPIYLSNGGAETALKAEGFRAIRSLGERAGKSFFEGTK